MSSESSPVERRPEPRKQPPWVWISICAALAIALISLVLANRFGGRITEVERPRPPAAPGVAATITPPPPIAPPVTVVEQPPPEPGKPPRPQAPPEVVRYVEHVRQVNAYRYKLQQAQTAQIAGAAWSALFRGLGVEEGEDKETEIVSAWGKLVNWFRSVPPPAECQSLGNTFGTALLASGVGVSRSLEQFAKLVEQPNLRLDKDLKATSVDIDARYASANTELKTLTDKYDNLPKFEILPDEPGTSLIGGQ